MLRPYKPINDVIYKAHSLIEFLIFNVWGKADSSSYKTKLNNELKHLCTQHTWLDTNIKNIYKACKKLDQKKREDFILAFKTNNEIEELCNGTISPISLETIDPTLTIVIIPFFNQLYTRFLGWSQITRKYGSKKAYYDKLIMKNDFVFCPCCGFGDIKTYNSKGHSPFDHYLPLKHYPFSAINFSNLVPMCHVCNSDTKGERDILKSKKAVLFPFQSSPLEISIGIVLNKKHLNKLITKIEERGHKIDFVCLSIFFTPDDAKVASWNDIFDIKARYFAKIADHRISWLDNVRSMYRKPHVNSFEMAFDEVIEDDSNKYLGFLKTPYLKDLKSYKSLIEAMQEVSGNSVIH